MSDPKPFPSVVPGRRGRSRAHAAGHAAAARLQAAHPRTLIWYGETSGWFYAMDTSGLPISPRLDTLARLLWQRAGGHHRGVGAR
ncbi:hypothetical protein SAMN02745673_02588 [Marinactinospora thermotolerans DSM 45154]|uniref:Uncharacterized protein n=1 Tax=Marinactinospora thermotolerans DSM 45154 TaxID=1122192 RepID=A0A1T4R7T3_9ACTN|nr:hypothetical protein SAMN02745673_02588 [Marinactinospora thermotolerans DSM 45154]